MTDFQEYFRKEYQVDFPVSLSGPLSSLRDLIWVSAELSGKIEHPPMLPHELFAQPDAYTLAGEWGHGVNSYAFYLVEKRGLHTRFFRLFRGGVYGRPEEDARAVVAYLTGYQRWRDRFESALSSSTLICNMGNSSAELVTSGGAALSYRGREEGLAWWEALEQRMP